jgi:hypothetical protein
LRGGFTAAFPEALSAGFSVGFPVAFWEAGAFVFATVRPGLDLPAAAAAGLVLDCVAGSGFSADLCTATALWTGAGSGRLAGFLALGAGLGAGFFAAIGHP